jgi:membrane fusion protein, multidrug efflux system
MKIRNLIPALLIITAIFSCKPKPVQNLEEMARRSAHPEAVLVKSIKLERSTFYHELISNGKVFPTRKAIVPFKVNGIIREINIQNGQKVSEGDLLALIEDYDFKTQLTRAKQGLEKAEIYFKDDLLSNFSTPDSTGIPAAQIKISRIRSGLNDAITSLSEAENNLGNTRIKAPITGIVSDLDAKQWNHSQNYKNLCAIINDEKMEVEFPVIESEYSFIAKGMPVGIIPFITDSALITGTISQINPRVDENGMVRVKAEFVNNSHLIDGMNVKIVIKKPEPNRLVVPKEALVIRQGKDVIFIRQDSLAIWKYVTVEFENSTSISVKDGLAPGDLVIIRGNINLAHETVVREQ